ncbi:hypothetical protein OS493_021108 [Desmophyllum pertusum]|uniref:Uncharacterized protein n=1 Tax=Desmophyllum pertusum TaxID=174260 RepID=A0A9X0D4F6_9CNID|nr:hypothetical protein OS493_021108 [Desmophyllum pertusum]
MVRRRLLFASFVHAFIVISFIALYMAGSKSPFTFMMQEWNSNTRNVEQLSGVESIQAVNLKRQATVREFCEWNNRIDESVDTKKLKKCHS